MIIDSRKIYKIYNILRCISKKYSAFLVPVQKYTKYTPFAVRFLNRDNIYNLLNDNQREFVSYVLRNYIAVGVDELDVTKLSTVLTAKYGSIHAAQEQLGSVQGLAHVMACRGNETGLRAVRFLGNGRGCGKLLIGRVQLVQGLLQIPRPRLHFLFQGDCALKNCCS